MSALSPSQSFYIEPFSGFKAPMDNESSQYVEAVLISKIAAGDQEAFKRLYEQTYGRLRFFLLRMIGDPSMVDDVLVETYAVVWQDAAKFGGKSKITTWIFGIARNLAMKERGKQKFHDNIDNFPHLSGGAFPEMETANRNQKVKEAMTEISANHREVLDLAFFHDLSYPEISKLLDIPVNTIKTRIFHAKKALESSLRKMRIFKNDI
ncbi:MAG: sigma-70 family RNA polymerase sigma factor [Proteobacteria bacterium]|nr:sigma-70 family RNA polymerase sigma factor [Pseudomonadota bacterium]